MTALLLAVAGASAACPEPVDAAALASALDRAEEQFGDLDPAGFVDALREATLDLPCIGAPVSPELAARYHTLVGLDLYGAGRLGDARGSFAAARAAAPDRGLPLSLVPAGHELHARFAEAPVDGPREPFPPPAAGELLLDGRSAEARPTDRPAIAQRVEADGAVSDTRYLLPGDPLPPYPPRAVPAAPDPAPVGAAPRGRRPPWAWLGVATAAGVGAATLYGLGEASEAKFDEEPPPGLTPLENLRRIEGLQRRTNLLHSGAAVAGIAAAGGAVGFAIHWAVQPPRAGP